jgi:lysophospholipase L1-like esterase
LTALSRLENYRPRNVGLDRPNAKRVVCFGDFLTWGAMPDADGRQVLRYPQDKRWTWIMASDFGSYVEVVEQGLCCRTTNIDDPLQPNVNGANHLDYTLRTHAPLDVVVIMLGTNDTKYQYDRGASEITFGLSSLVKRVLAGIACSSSDGSPPKTLIVAPPPLGAVVAPWQQQLFFGSRAKTEELAHEYKSMTESLGVSFLNSGQIIAMDGADGVSLSVQGNILLGHAVARKVMTMLI